MLRKQIGKLFRSIESFGERLHPAEGPLFTFPSWLRFPSFHSFNFILLHYLYLIFMTLLGSAILSGTGNLRYIDCLFFSAGAATQSGLNTVDINLMHTYQQATLLTMASLCNPIVINTFVVFVRLYWFEKRFQGVVRHAKEFRRARTKSRTKSEERKDVEWAAAREEGVGNREIKILHNETGTKIKGRNKDAIMVNAEKHDEPGSGDQTDSSSNEHAVSDTPLEETSSSPAPTFQRDIRFADEVRPVSQDIPNEDRVPERRSAEHHISFVENQRHPKDTGALRIPGPRDWDKGDLPQRVEENERDNDDDDGRRMSRGDGSPGQVNPVNPDEINEDDHPLKHDYEAEHSTRRKLKDFTKHLSLGRKSTEEDDRPTVGLRKRAVSHTGTFRPFLSQEREDSDPNPYLSYAPTIGRNSAFVDLTEEQREELGGIEYRSLKTLAWILLVYFFGWSIFGIIVYVPWILNAPKYKAVVQQDGQGAPWWGVYTSMSSFTDLGFTLTPDSMISFQDAVMPMLLGSFLIVIGNTGFPCMLRFIIWVMSHLVPYGSGIWEELHFLLDHPRRCFTLLFPKKATWWLFFVLVLLNGIDLIFFIILDLHDATVTDLSPAVKFLDGLFQASSTRTAGFSCVNLAELHPAIQVSYLIMMYISVFPIAISVRQTNVYEEKSLGIYSHGEELGDPDDPQSDHNQSYLGSHLRRQLSFDLWYVFLGLFLICIIEGSRLANTNEYSFTIFSVLFEIISAYGTVGLSLGYPNINASFSTEFHSLSKLIVVAMMLRGRHRGLPYALDRAILLPSESLEKKENEERERRRERRVSLASAHATGVHLGILDGSTISHHGGAGVLPVGARSRRDSAATVKDVEGKAKRFRSRSRSGLTKIISGALGAGPATKSRSR